MRSTTLLAAALALAGCRKDREPAPPAKTGADVFIEPGTGTVETGLTYDQVQDRMAGISRRQAAGFTDGKAELLRAFDAPGKAPAGTKLVGAELRLELPGGAFDPDDIDVVDADTSENFGSGPLLQRLTDAGEMAEWADPVFTDQHRFRIIAVWAVPPKVRRIRLEYWGQQLAGPAAITGTGPALPADPAEQATGLLKLGTGRLGVIIECGTCSRTARAPFYQLVVGDKLVEPARTLEVDAEHRPVTAKLETRPFYLPRAWVYDFVIPAGANPRELNQYGERTPLPAKAIELPPGTRTALDALPAAPAR